MAPVHEVAKRGDVEALAVIAREDPIQLRARDPFDRTPLLWVCNALLGSAARRLIQFNHTVN